MVIEILRYTGKPPLLKTEPIDTKNLAGIKFSSDGRSFQIDWWGDELEISSRDGPLSIRELEGTGRIVMKVERLDTVGGA